MKNSLNAAKAAGAGRTRAGVRRQVQYRRPHYMTGHLESYRSGYLKDSIRLQGFGFRGFQVGLTGGLVVEKPIKDEECSSRTLLYPLISENKTTLVYGRG